MDGCVWRFFFQKSPTMNVDALAQWTPRVSMRAADKTLRCSG
jgi:hypothetical protein